MDPARRELEAKETELFEQTLTGSLRAHLASRLRAAQGLVDGMNDEKLPPPRPAKNPSTRNNQ